MAARIVRQSACLLQVASLQGLSTLAAANTQPAQMEPGQAQAYFQQLSQSIAAALQEHVAPAASPSLDHVLPACMTGQKQQTAGHAEQRPIASAADAPLEKQSSSPGNLPVPELNTNPQQDLNMPPLSSCAERPVTWLAWEHHLLSEEPGPACGQLADEYMHPHTQWVLNQPLANYVLDPQPVVLKQVKQTASGGLITGSAAMSGSPSGDALGTGDPEADTATQQGSPDAQTPSAPDLLAATADAMQPNLQTVRSWGQLSRLGMDSDTQQAQEQQPPAQTRLANGLFAEQATPALSGFSASQPVLADLPADSEPCTPAISAASGHLLCRHHSGAGGPAKSSSRPLGRQRHSVNYNLLAGNRKMDPKSGSGVHKGAKKGLSKNSPGPQSDVRKDQAALAVSAAVADGNVTID